MAGKIDQVELVYFDFSGLGEPVRAMLHYGNIPFHDRRISKTEWPALKKNTKFGFLPVLKIDGIELCQSRAICRYIANKLNICGDDAVSKGMTDMWVDFFDDVRHVMVQAYYQPDSEERTKKLETASTVTLPKALAAVEKELVNGGKKYLVSDKITWAEVMFFGYFNYLLEILKSSEDKIFVDFPRVLQMFKDVKSSPGIKKWLLVRPASPPDFRVLFN